MSPDRSPSVIEQAGEATYLLCVVAFYGPPVLLLLVPWLLLGLMLTGPFLALLTVVVALCAAATLLTAAGALLITFAARVRRARAALASTVNVRVAPEPSP